jgi:hypothetical protein
MELLTIVNSLLIVIMAVLVVALLRGYAELLRRTDPHASHQENDGLETTSHRQGGLPRGRSRDDSPAFDVSGATLDGGSLLVSARGGRATLFAFLSSSCLTCQNFWSGMAEVAQERLPLDARIVAVTKDRDHESPHKLRAFATGDVPVIMSSKAWSDYGVEISPYFIFVDGVAGSVVSEGSATDWEQVVSLLKDSFEDLLLAGGDAPPSG